MCQPARMIVTGNRVVFQRATLRGLISLAWDVKGPPVAGMPDWMTRRDPSNFYDIDARTAPGTNPTPVQVRVMLQNLLTERSQLKVHHEPRSTPVYALVIGRSGHKLSEGVAIPCAMPGGDFMAGPGLLASCKPSSSIEQIAQMLSRHVDRVVIDKTGLNGKFAFRLQWSRDGAVQSDSPSSIFTAVQEQLGLRL